MNRSLFVLPAFALVLIAGCKTEVVEECAVKATIRVINNTYCTPDIELDGDVIVEGILIGDSIDVEVNANNYDVKAEMAFISLCEDQSWNFDVECGELKILTVQ
jgi:hypothetical protein